MEELLGSILLDVDVLGILELDSDPVPELDDGELDEKLWDAEDDESVELLLEREALEDEVNTEEDMVEELETIEDEEEELGMKELVAVWLELGSVIEVSPPIEMDDEVVCWLTGVVWLLLLLMLLPKFGSFWALAHDSMRALKSKPFFSMATMLCLWDSIGWMKYCWW